MKKIDFTTMNNKELTKLYIEVSRAYVTRFVSMCEDRDFLVDEIHRIESEKFRDNQEGMV